MEREIEMDQQDKKIRSFIKKLRRRLYMQSVCEWLWKGVCIGIGIGILVSLLSLVIPFYYIKEVQLLCVLLAVVGSSGIAWHRRPGEMQTALLADQKGCKEKISTALFLIGQENLFTDLQKKDALHEIERFDMKKEFPWHFHWKRAVCLLGICAIMCAVNQIETPVRQETAMRHTVQMEGKKEAKKVEQLAKTIKKASAVKKQEKEALLNRLKASTKEYRQVRTEKELKKAKQRLVQKLEQSAQDAKSKEMKQLLKKELEARGAVDAAKQLADAKEKGKTKSQGEGESPSGVNTSNGKGGGSTTEKSGAGQNAAQGKTDGKEGSGQDQKDGSKGSGQDGADGSEKNGQNGTGQKEKSQGGSSRQNGNSGQNGDSGQNGTSGQHGKEGASANGGNGTRGNKTGSGWNRGSKEGKAGKAKMRDTILIPEGTKDQDEKIQSKKGDGKKNSEIQKSNTPNAEAGQKVDYGQVSAKYKEKAMRQVEESQYPATMKEKIKKYFDGLE